MQIFETKKVVSTRFESVTQPKKWDINISKRWIWHPSFAEKNRFTQWMCHSDWMCHSVTHSHEMTDSFECVTVLNSDKFKFVTNSFKSDKFTWMCHIRLKMTYSKNQKKATFCKIHFCQDNTKNLFDPLINKISFEIYFHLICAVGGYHQCQFYVLDWIYSYMKRWCSKKIP